MTSLKFETIEVTIGKNGVSTITLNRPSNLNTFSSKLLSDLTTAFAYFHTPTEGEDIRVILLKANGKIFSAGVDVTDLLDLFNKSKSKGIELSNYIQTAQEAISSAENCRLPVIAAVHGD
mmetsp:Transcript_20880/g.23224  ORF Transcript_20880/g.23224 Transcript_20880/m.23224 type:complete len:120 (-) Transcript_20880:496-855(-)